jgi:predicted nucleotidyltransferase
VNLSETERDCLERYLRVLEEALGDELEEVWVFGSVARGESWPAGMRIRSDLDLLVVTRAAVAAELEQELVEKTYPLFLESGRQIGPTFWSRERLERPPDERARRFLENVRREAVPLRLRS